MSQYNTGNSVPSSDMRDAWDNNATLDNFLSNNELTVTTRTGIERDSLAGIQKKAEDQREQIAVEGAAVVEDTRQNLIPLSRQYMTLADAQADITNIPNGSATYVRSTDGSSLADEYINNNGVLVATGRRMPSQKTASETAEQSQRLLVSLHRLIEGINELGNQVDDNGNPNTGLLVGHHIITEALNELSGVPTDIADTNLNLLRSLSVIGERLTPLDNFDPQNVVSEDTVAQAVENYSTSKRLERQYYLPDPVNAGLIRIDVFVPSIPSSKTDPDVNGTVRIIVGGATIKTDCAFSVQGATSAWYPKKNFNIELFSDDTHSDNIDIKLGDLFPHDKLVFKSNWIDATHARNAMSYNLWRKIVNSRTSWPKNEVDTPLTGIYGVKSSFSGANGHPTLFPAVMYINDEFYGIGSFGTAKKYKNYNLEKNKPLQIQLDHGGWTPVNKFVDAVAAGGIEISAPKSPTQATTDALATWDAFATRVMSGDTVGWENIIDKQNFIDFILLVEFIFAADLISNNNIKNVQMITYDGLRWFFMPYDLDTVYGLSWTGASLEDNATKIFINDNGSFWRNLIAAVGANNFSSRYASLRRKEILSPAGISEHIRTLQSSYSRDLFDTEWAKWPQVPSLSITSPDQIIRWVQSRTQFLDKKYGYSGS